MPLAFSAFRRHSGQKSISSANAYASEREQACTGAKYNGAGRGRSPPGPSGNFMSMQAACGRRRPTRVRLRRDLEGTPDQGIELCRLLAGRQTPGIPQLTFKDIARSWVLPFIDPRQLAWIIRLPQFFAEWMRFRGMAGKSTARLRRFTSMPDRSRQSYAVRSALFYQAAWLAREINRCQAVFSRRCRVERRVETGVLSAFVPRCSFIQAAASPSSEPGFDCGRHHPLAFRRRLGAIDMSSAACRRAYPGLGRYGDRLDPEGWRNALGELARVLAPGGRLYLSRRSGASGYYSMRIACSRR